MIYEAALFLFTSSDIAVSACAFAEFICERETCEPKELVPFGGNRQNKTKRREMRIVRFSVMDATTIMHLHLTNIAPDTDATAASAQTLQCNKCRESLLMSTYLAWNPQNCPSVLYLLEINWTLKLKTELAFKILEKKFIWVVVILCENWSKSDFSDK